MRITIPALGLITLAFIPVTGCSKPTAELEPSTLHLDSPQRRAIVLKTTTKQTVRVLGESVEQVFEEDLRYTLDIGAAGPDGNAAFTSTMDFFSLDMETGLLEGTPSGMDPATMMMRPMNEIFRAARGLSYTGSIAPDCSVPSLGGLEELQKAVLDKLATRTLPPEYTGTTVMQEIVETLFDEEGSRKELEQILLRRPAEPLTEGYGWSGETQSPFGTVELPATVEFTVDTVSPESIRVIEKVTLTKDDASVKAFRNALSMDSAAEIIVTGNGNGAYQIDPVSGWVVTHTRGLVLNIVFKFDGGAVTITTQISRALETFSD